MYKLTYPLFKLDDRLEVDVAMYIQDEEQLRLSMLVDNAKEKAKTYNRYAKGMDKYIRFNSRAFIELKMDINQKDVFDKNKYVKCNKYDLFILIKYLERVAYTFKNTKDLFYYDDNKVLHLNEERKNAATVVIPLKERTLKVEPSLIVDTVSNKQHEGITIYVNTANSYCFITYSELEFLLYELKKVDIDSIASLLYMIETLENRKPNTVIVRQPVVVKEVPKEQNNTTPNN